MISILASMSGYFYNLDPDPGPWTQTLDPDPGPGPSTRSLDPDPKNLGSENLNPAKPGPCKTWTLQNLDLEKHGKRLDMEKCLEDHIL